MVPGNCFVGGRDGQDGQRLLHRLREPGGGRLFRQHAEIAHLFRIRGPGAQVPHIQVSRSCPSGRTGRIMDLMLVFS